MIINLFDSTLSNLFVHSFLLSTLNLSTQTLHTLITISQSNAYNLDQSHPFDINWLVVGSDFFFGLLENVTRSWNGRSIIARKSNHFAFLHQSHIHIPIHSIPQYIWPPFSQKAKTFVRHVSSFNYGAMDSFSNMTKNIHLSQLYTHRDRIVSS